MTPFPTLQQMEANAKEPGVEEKIKEINGRWPEHLNKRFVHEEIFGNVSENRDFILSLPPNLIYPLSQLWIEFCKAKKLVNPEGQDLSISSQEWNKNPDLKAHTIQWYLYLLQVCRFLDEYGKMPSFSEDSKQNMLYEKIFKEWDILLRHYYPNLKPLDETRKSS
jgi:hypothetical protein